jgi:uncharacterized Zn finger protein
MRVQIGRFDYNRGYVVDWERIESALGGPGQAVELRRGPFQVTRERKLARTWWAQVWVEGCEAQTVRKTINKGRRIGRDGSTLVVRLAPGDVGGVVIENPYYMYQADIVGFTVPTLSTEHWQIVDDLIESNARYIAALLAGELPYELYERLGEAGMNLIPQPFFYSHGINRYGSQVTPHGLALAYITGTFLSNDPMLLFRLLGRDPDVLLSRWTGEVVSPDEESSPPSDLSSFWINQQLPSSEDLLSVTQPPNIELLPPEYLGQIPEILNWVADEAAFELEEMPSLFGDTVTSVFPPTNRVPDVALKPERQVRYNNLIGLTDPYCENELDAEFAMLARRLARALAAQPNAFVTNGQVGTWAAAIVYALAEVNQLFEDNDTGYRLDPNALCEAFKRSPTTTPNRARRIRKRLGIGTLDPDWTHSMHLVSNPRAQLVRVRGFLVSQSDD